MSNEQQNITPNERKALDELGRNFDELLARTPEPRPRGTNRKYVLAGIAVAAGLLALLAWAVWPTDSRFSVESAIGSIADIASAQTTPDPTQFVESENVTTLLLRTNSRDSGPPGVKPGGFYTSYLSQHAWLSMSRPGVIQTRGYAKGPEGDRKDLYTGRSTPLPDYRIAGNTYTPAQIAKLADRPELLIRDIDAKVRELPKKFRPEMKWQYLVAPLKAIAPPLPSSIRAELIRSLESIPGVAEPQKKTDPRGREGLQLELVVGGIANHALFDPHDAQLLYTEAVVRDDGAGRLRGEKPGDIEASYLLLTSRVVDSAPRVEARSK